MSTLRKAHDVFNDYAEKYNEDNKDIITYAQYVDHFTSMINNPHAKICDIACGPGNYSRYLINKNPSWNILGLDASEKMISLAQENLKSVHFKCANILDSIDLDMRFDGLFCSFLIAYLNIGELETLIAKCALMGSASAVLYISAQEGQYEDSKIEYSSDNKNALHIYYYNISTLKPILDKHNFTLEKSFSFSTIHNEKTVKEFVVLARKINA